MLHLYNTLTRQKEEFKPIKAGHASIYSCGPTVHGRQHLGNLRSALIWDTLGRVLTYNGYTIKHIVNITDFGHLTSNADSGEDKMMNGLRAENLPISLPGMTALAEKYTNLYFEDRQALNVHDAHTFPRATHYIGEDIAFIQALEQKSFVYTTSDGVYFDTSKNSDYGKLRGGRSITIDPEHARIDHNSEKRSPEDFAVWKFNSDLGWESPWGKGFPGWHIECSVMSHELLGDTFDIHTGGKEHIAIHHTNEIAQSESLTGKPMAQYWLHNNWLTMASDKLAKSTGNVAYLSDVVEKGFSPLAFRYLTLQAHYRSEQDFSWDALQASAHALSRLKNRFHELPEGGLASKAFQERFRDVVNDDLNTPQALALVWELLKDSSIPDADKKTTLLDFDAVLGLNLGEYLGVEIPEEVQKLLNERQKARDEKNWAEADELRNNIEAEGFVVKDTDSGQEVSQK